MKKLGLFRRVRPCGGGGLFRLEIPGAISGALSGPIRAVMMTTLLAVVVAGGVDAQQDDDKAPLYMPPLMTDTLFDLEQIFMTEGGKVQLVEALTAVAVQVDCPPLARSRALGIALRLDPIYRPAFTANIMLKQGREPSLEEVKFSSFEASAAGLGEFAGDLRAHDQAGDTNYLLAAYLLDLAFTLDPTNVDYAYDAKVLARAGSKADWLPVTGTWNGTSEIPAAGSVNAVAGKDDAEDGEVEMTTPLSDSGSDSDTPELPRLQALVKGLLVRPLEANRFAGKASQMNATATPFRSRREMKVGFNQSVGDSMHSALGEVIKYLRLRHDELPQNYKVEIAFEEQYIPKDGPSAAVACALLLESMIKDLELDDEFAVTGDLNADGTVQPVGGITGKLRGAAARDCNVVAIPVKNARVISDMLIMEGPRQLTRIQIFSLKNFDQALALGVRHELRSEDIRTSIETFEEVRKLLNQPNGMRYLKNSHVQARLRECVKLTPNHLSARNLLLASVGRTPERLSLSGSLEYIDRSAEPLLRVLRQGSFDKRGGLEEDEFADSASALRRIRTKLDMRVVKICDSIIEYSQHLRTFVNDRPTSYNGMNDLIDKINAAGRNISREYDDLESRVDVQEELMR